MLTIFASVAQTQSTTPAPATVVAISLAALSVFLVVYKATDLYIVVRTARRKAEAIRELTESVRRIWEVKETPSGEVGEIKRLDKMQKSLILLSQIDLEGYLVDKKTRDLIDNALMLLHPKFIPSSERG